MTGRGRALVVVALGVLSTSGVRAEPSAPAPGRAAPGKVAWKTERRSAVNLELGFDSNARRVSSDRPTFLVTPDLLAYAFGQSTWRAARPGQTVTGTLDLGGKLFLATPAENVLAGRGRLAYVRRIGRRSALTLGASYQDKFQRGDSPDEVAGTELACAPQGSIEFERSRCNARDYRLASLEALIEGRATRALTLGARAGAVAIDYKPSRQFSFLAPRLGAQLGYRISRRQSLHLGLEAAYRLYHPDSRTWQTVPSGSGSAVVAVDTPRRELVPTLRAGWAYRGRLLVSVDAAVARTVNNSFGLDALRLRVDLSLALRLREGTHLVVGGALQSAYYPEGNVLRGLSLVGDESERQSSLTLRLSQAAGRRVSLLLKVQIYTNEISGQVLPFRRLVVQLGLTAKF